VTTDELVDEFAHALKLRLRQRARQGKTGWEKNWWRDECLEKFKESANNEEILDTAGYAAFAYYHGWGNN